MTVELGSTSPAVRATQGFRHPSFWCVLLLSLLILAAYFESFTQVAHIWSDPDSRVAHGWLALAAGLAVLFVNLPRQLIWPTHRARVLAIVGALLAGLLWLLCVLLAVESLAQVAAFAVLALAIHAVFGAPIARETDRILVVLACALPVLEGANDLFQRTSVAVASTVVGWLDIPVRMKGFFVEMPAGTFEIEPLCSGLQFFIAAATTGALLAAMRRETWTRTALLMLCAGLIGLLANWIRVVTVILAGYLSDMQNYLVHSEHFTLGWSLFVLGIGSYVWWIGRRPLPARARVAATPTAATAPSPRAWIPALLLLAPPMALGLGAAHTTPVQPPVFATFAAPGWDGPMASWSAWAASPGSATQRIVADFTRGPADRVTVVVARYQPPEKAPELQLSVKGFLPDADWQALAREPQVVPAGGAHIEALRELLRDPGGRRWVFLHWFQVGNRSHASALQARLQWSLRHATGSAPPFLAVIFSSQCADDCVAESAAVTSLATAAATPLMSQMGVIE